MPTQTHSPSAAAPLLQAEGLSKNFGGVAALQDAGLEAAAGEIHALLGENGAGKSTLIKILSGALRPDSGSLVLDGEALSVSRPQDAVAAGISAVFQELSLVPDLTVAQNVWFGREPRTPLATANGRKLKRLTAALFERYGVAGIAVDALVKDLSVGQRQVVEIVKAVSTEPRVLILDEATSALSLNETRWLLDLARQLADEGTLIIFISHRIREVRELADRATILRSGQAVGTYDLEQLSDDEIVTLMLGRRAGALYPDRDGSSSGEPLLEVRDLRVGHRLRAASFDLRAGEILGVGGLQGHGQLELFLALAGATRSRGTIEIGGRSVSFHTPRDAMKAGVGIVLVPEDRKTQGLLLPKTVRENITLGTLRGLSRFGLIDRKREQEVIEKTIEEFQIVLRSPEQLVSELSGGNQQKVVIAKALLTDAKILLLYDLTRGVDVGAKAEIFKLMARLAESGYGLLFFSTDNEELVHICDRVAVLSYGEVAAVLEDEGISDERILHASLTNETAATA